MPSIGGSLAIVLFPASRFKRLRYNLVYNILWPITYVAFPENLLKTIATRGAIFSLKFTKTRLAAGLRPDPLGELKRFPRHPSRNKGAYF